MIIHYFEQVNNIQGIAKGFGIEPKGIQNWGNKKQELLDAASYVLTLNCGHQTQYLLLEERLIK